MALTPEQQKRLEELEKLEAQERESSFVPPSPATSMAQDVDAGEYTKDVRDLLAGAAQGATLGFGDEALAALQATLAKPENVSWYEDYRRRQKENEEAYKQMQERSPWLTMGGELAGGFAIPVGALLKGAKAGAEGAKLAGAALGGEKAAAKAKAAFDAYQAAKTGAIAGGVAGLGASEKTIEEAPALIQEGLTGAALGGALGGLATKGLQFGKEYIEESPRILKGFKALEMEAGAGGEAPINITTREGQKTILNKLDDTTNTILNKTQSLFKEHKDNLTKAIADNAKVVPSDSSKLDIKNAFEKVKDLAEKGNESAIRLYNSLEKHIGSVDVGKMLNGTANVSDLNNIRKAILQNSRKIIDDAGQDAANFLKNTQLLDKLDEGIETVIPKIKELRQNIKDSAQPLEVILNKTDDPLAQYKKLSDYEPEQLKNILARLTSKHVEDLSAGATRGAKARDAFDDFIDALKTAESKLGKKTQTPINPEEIEKLAKETADQISVMKTSIGEENIADPRISSVKNIASGNISDWGYTQLMGKLGRTEANLGQPVQKLLKTGKATTAQLQNFANILKNSNKPVIKQIGESATAALESGDAASKAAILNSIMQNPEARKLINTGE